MDSLLRRGPAAAVLLSVHIILYFCCGLTGAKTVPALYVFGDSLVDSGNNNYLPLSILRADFVHNGIDYTGRKPTGRFSNGKNAADFVAEHLKLLPAPPYLSRRNGTFATGANFASGGSGILNTTNNNAGVVQNIPLRRQLWYFSKVRAKLLQDLGSKSATLEHFSQSILLFVVGSNDVINFAGTNKSKSIRDLPADQYVALMGSTFKRMLKAAHTMGARKFVIAALPPVGCSPKQRSEIADGECNMKANSLCEKVNAEFSRILPELKSEIEDFHYIFFDTYRVLMNFIQNPENYGFTETRSACCGLGNLRSDIPCIPVSLFCSNRSNHVFWDIYHPTERAARFTIDALFSDSSEHVTPITVSQLIEL